jgi:hypothetical protein
MNEWKHKNCFYYFKIEFLFDQIDTCHSKDKMTKKILNKPYFIYTSIGWKFFFLFIKFGCGISCFYSSFSHG